MGPLFDGSLGVWFKRSIVAAVALLVLFLAVEVVAGVKSWRYIGAGVMATNTIMVNGHGETFSVPDIATFTFSVLADKATVADAQKDATTKINAITDYLTGAGIDKKDIQTSDYSIYPQYDYQNAVCPTMAPSAGNSSSAVYCPPGRQTLRGYEVRQTTTIKIRDTAKAGELLAGVGNKGATEVSSLTFTFDDPNKVQIQARDKAIADAKSKADALARSLGVSLVRVVSFNENGNFPSPVYYAKMAGGMGATADAASPPSISTGQNKITDDVTITYEIR